MFVVSGVGPIIVILKVRSSICITGGATSHRNFLLIPPLMLRLNPMARQPQWCFTWRHTRNPHFYISNFPIYHVLASWHGHQIGEDSVLDLRRQCVPQCLIAGVPPLSEERFKQLKVNKLLPAVLLGDLLFPLLVFETSFNILLALST